MTVNRVLLLAICLLATQVWANPEAGKSTQPRPQGNAQVPPGDGPNGLRARVELPKRSKITKPVDAERLAIKFRDSVRARAGADRSVSFTTAFDSTEVQTIAARYNLQFRPAITTPPEIVESILARAEAYSGKAQPDLYGMMFIDGPADKLEIAANELLKLDSVEFVYFQRPYRTAPVAGPPTGACCEGETCTVMTEADCSSTLGGIYMGDGVPCDPNPCMPPPPPTGACCIFNQLNGQWNCAELDEATCLKADGVFTPSKDGCMNVDCDFDCGDGALADCFTTHGYPFCNDNDCCELVGDYRPFCVETEWDEICVGIANLYCDPNIGADRCASPFNGDCLEEHFTGGCIDPDCCMAVCDLDSFCCDGFWDFQCVQLAYFVCLTPTVTPGATPDFCAYQGYLRASGYLNQYDIDNFPAPGLPGLPYPAPGVLPPYQGWGGEGMALFGEGPSIFEPVRLRDDPNMSIASGRYQGLYGLGRELHEVYGLGSQNGARGAGIKVAVIEWAYFKDHEDLSVIPEPGLTMITTGDVTEPDHATACLGIINAKDDARGMVGIAPDAQAYFFPLTSAETGPRFFEAFMSCFNTLGPGDVCSNSWGPAVNLNNEEFGNVMLTLGSDLGITMVVAAANSCINLSDLEGLPDSGAIVVGACHPGAPWCRLSFSNYYRTDTEDSNTVHISAWGQLVAAPGYGDLWFPNGNKNRSYTSRFSGTSAATPQVAGVAACLQGLAKQFYGIPLAPDRVRAAIMGEFLSQCQILNPANRPGFDEAQGCGPDLNPEFEENLITGYIAPRSAATVILNQQFVGFDQSPNVREVFILRGSHLFGNKYSLKGIDNQYFVVRSMHTKQNFVPSVGAPGSEVNFVASRATYMGTGQTTDIMVRAQLTTKRPSSIGVGAVLSSPDLINFAFVELFDFTTQSWTFVTFLQFPGTPPGADFLIESLATNGTRFISPQTRSVYARIHILSGAMPDAGSLSAGGQGLGTAKRFDWIHVYGAGENQVPF